MKKLLFLMFMMFSSISFGAVFKNGNELYEQLKYKDSNVIVENVQYLIGTGYVLGVVDSRFSKCNFDNVIASQLFDTVLMYLTNFPERRQYTASSLVEVSIKEKFKCK